MKKIILISVFLFSFSFSQSLLGVRYPTGVSYPVATASARMGGAGAGLKEPYLVNSLNPANVGAIKQSVYSLSVNADYQRVIGENRYSDFYSFSPSFIGFAFPIGKAGTLGASFGQNGSNNYSYSGESFLYEEQFLTEPASKTDNWISQLQKFDNSISHSSWEFGWGMELFKRFSLGASYKMGQYKNRMVRSDVLDNYTTIIVSDNVFNVWDTIRTTVYSGLDSIYYSQAGSAVSYGLLGNFSKLGVGFGMTLPFNSDIKSKRVIRSLSSDTSGNYNDSLAHKNSTFEKIYKMQLPPSMTLGFSYEFSDKLKTALDFNLILWEKYKTDAPFLDYEANDLLLEDGGQLDKLANALRISGGAQFIPQPNLLSSKYYQKIRYSGGLSYKQLSIDGDWETSLSVGLGLPLGNRGIVDFSLETGLRRSQNYDDYKENFVRVNFGMGGGQVWKKSSNNIY